MCMCIRSEGVDYKSVDGWFLQVFLAHNEKAGVIGWIFDFNKAEGVPIGIVFNGLTVNAEHCVFLRPQDHFPSSGAERD